MCNHEATDQRHIPKATLEWDRGLPHLGVRGDPSEEWFNLRPEGQYKSRRKGPATRAQAKAREGGRGSEAKEDPVLHRPSSQRAWYQVTSDGGRREGNRDMDHKDVKLGLREPTVCG